MARITVAKLFETVAEVDQRSQVALMQSEDSIKISEKNRINLERLIATLRTDFTDIEQTEEIIRADKEEDNTIRSSFFELQKSFDGLVGTVDILRTDLDNLYESFYTSQIKRQDLLNQEEAKVFKEEDDLQKGRGLEKEGKGALSNMFGNKKDPNQVAQKRKKEEKSLVKSILSTLGLGALAGGAMGLGDAFGSDDQGGGGGDADAPDLKTKIRQLESGNDYSSMYARDRADFSRGEEDITKMTIDEVDQLQTDYLNYQASKGYDKSQRSAAMGAYQMIEVLKVAKLLGIDTSKTKFDKETQDKMSEYYLNIAGYQDFKSGKITAKQFNDRLAGQFASVKTTDGTGVYDGDGMNTGYENIMPLLEKLKKEGKDLKSTPTESKPTETMMGDKSETQSLVELSDKGPEVEPTPSTGGQDESKTKYIFDFGFGEIDLSKPLGAEGKTTQVDPETGELSIVPQPKNKLKNREQEFRKETARREALPENQVGAKADRETRNMIDQEIYIGKTGQLPPNMFTPIQKAQTVASLQPNRSPNTSVINLPGEVIDGGTENQQQRGKASSQSTALSNTRNGAPVAMMIETKYLV